MSPPLLLLPSSTETPQNFRHPSSLPSKHPPHFDPTALRSAADHLLQSLASHPFLKPLASLHSQYRSFLRVHFRNPRVPSHRNSFSSCNFAAILPGDSVAGLVVANGINSFLNLYNTLLVVRLVLTWFPNSPPAIVSPLSTICDPYLNIFRGIIPPLGGTLDLSPILAFLVLNVFTSSAAALPAELPPPQPHLLQNHTATQVKWLQRLTSMTSKKQQH